jgi:hypothetical protein
MRLALGARALVAAAALALLVAGVAQAVPPKKTPKLSITLTASAVDPTSGQYTLTVTGDGYGTPQAVWPSGHIHFTCGQQAGLICNTDSSWRSAGVLQDPPLFETTVVCRNGDSSIQAFDDDNGIKSNKIKAPTC